MNQKLKQIDVERVLFWDLETVREHEYLDPESEAYHLFEAKNRDRVTENVLEQSEVLALYNKTGALSPTHTKIVCASMGFISKGTLYIKSLVGEQGLIIEEFCKVLSRNYIPCGYNIVSYDFPILRQKAFQEGLLNLIPERFNDSNKKEWAFTEYNKDTNVIDLMLYLKGTYFYNQSLAEACYLAGVPSPKNEGIDGSMVSDVYYAEGVGRIKDYCERDIVSTANLFLKMRGEALITNVEYKETSYLELGAERLPEPLFQSIRTNGCITAEDEKKILDKLKDLDSDERSNLVTILKACLGKKDDELTKSELTLIKTINGTKRK